MRVPWCPSSGIGCRIGGVLGQCDGACHDASGKEIGIGVERLDLSLKGVAVCGKLGKYFAERC